MLTVSLLVNSCGTPAPIAQTHSDQESTSEAKQPNRWQQRVGQSALVISGALVASCLLIAKVRKLCADIVAPEQAKNITSSRVNDEVLLSMVEALQKQQHSAEEIAQMREELALLRLEFEDYRDYLDSRSGRQANLTGTFMENNTLLFLPGIIADLYKGEEIIKMSRNVEGNFLKSRGKDKDFEIDVIAITAERVFVIETKTTLRRKDVDRLVSRLENFHQLSFADKKLNKLIHGKPVHGGFSYRFNGKISPKDNVQEKRASEYARKHKLLTIPSFLSHKSSPKQVTRLRNFAPKK